MGKTVGPNDVLVRYTLAGDTNLNHSVTIADFSVLAANFNQSGGWSNGDFTYTGNIGIEDFALPASNFNRILDAPTPAPVATVPEPTAAIAGMMASVLLANLRRRQ